MTSDIGKALEFSQKVEAGTVWVNCYNQVCCQAGSFLNTEYIMIFFVLVHVSKGIFVLVHVSKAIFVFVHTSKGIFVLVHISKGNLRRENIYYIVAFYSLVFSYW